jgi:hypothetical protein
MRTLPLLIAALALVLVACRKDRVSDPNDRDYTLAQDNIRSEFFFNDLYKQSELAFKNGEVPCAVAVSFDLDAEPATLHIDFGSENCTAADGLRRRGSLLVTFTGAYAAEGTVITVTPQEYHVNDHRVQGTKTLTNAGPDDQGRTHFLVNGEGSITAPDADWTTTHSFQRTRTWIAGEGTPDPFDDVYLIGGAGSGVNRNGSAYTVEITTPLRIEVGCPWIISGVQQLMSPGRSVRIIDYGNGCNSAVSFTVNGLTFTIGGGG